MVKSQKGSGNNNNNNNTNNFVMVNSPNLKSNIISYNLSWATQKNEVAGTEKEYVKWCQKSAKSRKSNFNRFLSDSNIDSNESVDLGFKSWCTKNGLDGIIEYVNKNNSNPIQFIGFQECTDLVFEPTQSSVCLNYLNDGLRAIKLEQINSDKTVHMNAYVSLLFNTALYTKIDDLHGDMDPKSGRPYLISSFQNKFNDLKTIVCVLHATHESKVRDDYINYTIIPDMYKLGDNDINNRYILLGDFNGLPKFYKTNENVDINNMFTQYKGSNLPNSCCWQNSHGFTLSKGFYNGISDIIYDSSNLASINPVSIVPGFGTQFNSKTRKHKQNIPSNVKTGSDHLPVCLKYGIVDMVSSQNMLPGQKRKKSKKLKSKKLKSKKPKKQKTRKYRK